MLTTTQQPLFVHRRRLTGALLGLLAGAALTGCGGDDGDDLAAELSEVAGTDIVVGDDGGVDTAAAATGEGTLAFDGQDLPVEEVVCTEAVTEDSPNAVIASFVHPDDGEEYDFRIGNHGQSAAIYLPKTYELSEDRDRWEHYPYLEPETYGEDWLQQDATQIPTMEYSHDGASGEANLYFHIDTSRYVDPDFEAPDRRPVEFDLTCG